MLQATELRIGNYIEFADRHKLVEVEEIYRVHPYPEYFIEWVLFKDGIKTEKHGNSLLSEFAPVSLTPGMLEFLGFEVVNTLDHFIIYTLFRSDARQVSGSYYKDRGFFKLNSLEKEVYFLHQLQNILFELFSRNVQAV